MWQHYSVKDNSNVCVRRHLNTAHAHAYVNINVNVSNRATKTIYNKMNKHFMKFYPTKYITTVCAQSKMWSD